MSNRAERRAAERLALKAARAQSKINPVEQAQPSEQTCAIAASQSFTQTASEPESTASEAQIKANRENAQKSTGPTTPQGRIIVSENRRSHALIGKFLILPDEDVLEFLDLVRDVTKEYDPQTPTEHRLVQSVIQHYWMMNRAVRLQNQHASDDKKIVLYLRYQTTHERAYYKAQKELQQIQKDRAKEQIGFERKKLDTESQEAKIRLAHAKAQTMEINAACRKVMEAPLPGNTTIGFEQLAKVCSEAIAFEVAKTRMESAAAAD